MSDLTATVSEFACNCNFCRVLFSKFDIRTVMEFYHRIMVVLQSVIYSVYYNHCKSLFICVKKTIRQLHQRMYPLLC